MEYLLLHRLQHESLQKMLRRKCFEYPDQSDFTSAFDL